MNSFFKLINLGIIILISFIFGNVIAFGGVLKGLGLLLAAIVLIIGIVYYEKFVLTFIFIRPALEIFNSLAWGGGYLKINIISIFTIVFVFVSIVRYFTGLIKNKKYFVPLELKFYLIFLFISLISSFLNFKIVGVGSIAVFFRLVTAFFIVLHMLSLDKRQFKTFVTAVALSVIFPAIVGFLQIFFRFGLTVGDNFARINGGFAHSNVFAAFIGMFFVGWINFYISNDFMLYKRKVFILLLILLGILLLFTYSRGVWLSIVISTSISLLFFHKIKYKVTILPLFFLIVILIIFLVPSVHNRFADVDITSSRRVLSTDSNSLGWRINYWRELINDLIDNQAIWGFGLGSTVILGSAHMEAHNNYVQTLFETGVGAIFYWLGMLILFLRSLVYFIRTKKFKCEMLSILSVFLYYFILSFSAHLIRNTILQIYFFILFFLFIVYRNQEVNEEYIYE